MFRLRTGYFISGITTGLILLLTFIWTLPDGKLHIVFCNVGQGDGAYVRFPDGRDMVVDGGPNDQILQCLGRAMPFWDRHINMVVMTHPQKDHMQGLIEIINRYGVDYVVRSDIDAETEGYKKLQAAIAEKNIPVRFMTTGSLVRVDGATLSFLWPSPEQISKQTANKELNDYSLVFLLSYGEFDAVFTGDADRRVEAKYAYELLANEEIEVLKVPHHGSKTGMTDDFIGKIRPKLSVISVGKNSYGHPTREAIAQLEQAGSRVLRTDTAGNIEVVSDGKGWTVKNVKAEKEN